MNCKIYAIGGYDDANHSWHGSIESIPLPNYPKVEPENNYNTLKIGKVPRSNQTSIVSKSDWHLYETKMDTPRSHFSVSTQIERYIYVF